jgi:hypothetical protein
MYFDAFTMHEAKLDVTIVLKAFDVGRSTAIAAVLSDFIGVNVRFKVSREAGVIAGCHDKPGRDLFNFPIQPNTHATSDAESAPRRTLKLDITD